MASETNGAAIGASPSTETLSSTSGRSRRKPPQRGKAGGRTKVRSLWFTEGEHARLEAKAARAGLSVSSYLRTAALGDAGPRARRAPTVEKELLASAIAELNKVGSNINQIARAVNIGKDYDDAFLRYLVDEMRPVLTRILRAINT